MDDKIRGLKADTVIMDLEAYPDKPHDDAVDTLKYSVTGRMYGSGTPAIQQVPKYKPNTAETTAQTIMKKWWADYKMHWADFWGKPKRTYKKHTLDERNPRNSNTHRMKRKRYMTSTPTLVIGHSGHSEFRNKTYAHVFWEDFYVPSKYELAVLMLKAALEGRYACLDDIGTVEDDGEHFIFRFCF